MRRGGRSGRRACPSCGREWGGSAIFCGGCGARLGDLAPAEAATARRRPATRAWWQHPALRWAAVAVLAVGALIAVPRLLNRLADPVPGEIAVPDADDIQALEPEGRGFEPDPGPTPLTPDDIQCERDDQVFDCVAWIIEGSVALGPMSVLRDASSSKYLLVTSRAFGSGSTALLQLDPATGSEVASWELDDPPSDLLVHGTDVLLAGGSRLTLMSLEDGGERWSVPIPVQEDQGGPGLAGLDDRFAFVTVEDQPVTAVEARHVEDGTLAWRWESEAPDPVHFGLGAVLLTPDRVAAFNHMEAMVTYLDATSGRPAWTQELTAQEWWSATDDGVAIATERGAEDGAGPLLTARAPEDGSLRWQVDLSADGGPLVVFDDVIAVPAGQQLLAVDVMSGEVRWAVDADEEPVVGPPDWLEPHTESAPRELPVLTVDQQSVLRARAPATGDVLWEREMPSGSWPTRLNRELALVQSETRVLLVDLTTGGLRLTVPTGSVWPLSASPLVLVTFETDQLLRVELSDGP